MFSVAELLKASSGKLISGKSNLRADAVSIDSRTIGIGECFVAVKGEKFDGHDFIDNALNKGASVLIINQSRKHKVKVPEQVAVIAVKDTTKALGDIAGFHRNKFNIPVVCVTGSNGKTTTKDMIAWVLSASGKVLKSEGTKNNHIGLPMTLLKINGSYDYCVLEAGTNHPGEISYLGRIARPNIAVITNIGPSHLKHFSNLENVLKEKYSLLKQLIRPRIALLNTDNSLLEKRSLRHEKNNIVIGFGVNEGADFRASDLKTKGTRVSFAVNGKHKIALTTLGRFNITNALSSIAIGRIFGMDYRLISRRLSSFNFPKSRLNFIELSGLRFIDDTYNSNPLSLMHALEALKNYETSGRKVLVMGDMLELGSNEKFFHALLGEAVAKTCDCLVAVGKLSGFTAEAAKRCGLDPRFIFRCPDSTKARKLLFKKVNPDKKDVILVKGSRMMRMEEVFKF